MSFALRECASASVFPSLSHSLNDSRLLRCICRVSRCVVDYGKLRYEIFAYVKSVIVERFSKSGV